MVPQISVILGPCAGGAVYSPAITDFIFMVEKTAHMFITGPEVVKAVTHQDVSFDQLGGAAIHREQSGVAHFTAPDEETLLSNVRWLLSFLPANNLTSPPYLPPSDDPHGLSRNWPRSFRSTRSSRMTSAASSKRWWMAGNFWKSRANTPPTW